MKKKGFILLAFVAFLFSSCASLIDKRTAQQQFSTFLTVKQYSKFLKSYKQKKEREQFTFTLYKMYRCEKQGTYITFDGIKKGILYGNFITPTEKMPLFAKLYVFPVGKKMKPLLLVVFNKSADFLSKDYSQDYSPLNANIPDSFHHTDPPGLEQYYNIIRGFTIEGRSLVLSVLQDHNGTYFHGHNIFPTKEIYFANVDDTVVNFKKKKKSNNGGGNSGNIVHKLKQLKKLYTSGLITKSEYNKKRKKILSQY